MKKFSPLLATAVFGTAVLSAGCKVLAPEKVLQKECNELIRSSLKDPVSYRVDSEPSIVQEVSGQPKVWAWAANARNSMGGYGDGFEVLCYRNTGGATKAVMASADRDGAKKKNQFLSQTNPALAAQLQAADDQYQESVRSICEPFRAQWTGGNRVPDGCIDYFLSGMASADQLSSRPQEVFLCFPHLRGQFTRSG